MKEADGNTGKFVPGLTPVSLGAALLGLLLTGVLTQYGEVVVGINFPAEHTLAVPAIISILVISILAGILYSAFRFRLLNRQEMLCVAFILLIATPLMTQGFWHRVLAITSTIPRTGDFAKVDTLSEKLWPHGPNLLASAFHDPSAVTIETQGGVHTNSSTDNSGRREIVPILSNATPADVSAIRITLPDGGSILPNDPYMISVLVRATGLGPASCYYARAYPAGSATGIELFRSAAVPERTFVQRTGFGRVGAYGVKLPSMPKSALVVEFALRGTGLLELRDPQLVNVSALESAYKGRRVVTQSAYNSLPPDQRSGLVIKPDHMLSLQGIRYLVAGYIPVRAWATPVLAWTAFVLLVLLGCFTVNILVRKQWMDGERFQLPMSRIPIALVDDGEVPSAMPPIWRNGLMWLGLGLALTWELLKAWHFYNPSVPDLTINVPLASYFDSPNWGQMWTRMRFEIVTIFLALGIFMELNVLLSMVIGVFLFHSEYWIGRMFEWDTNPQFPWSHHQGLGAFFGYAAIILFFARKPLWRVLKAGLMGGRNATPHGEAVSYRAALLILAGCAVGACLWARYVGAGVTGILVFFALLLLVGFVACRLRTECGTPWGYIVPVNVAVFILMIGGLDSFGANSVITCYLASFMMSPTVFFLIPGAQMELLEWGNRWSVTPRHLLWAGILGVVGGMLVGGWVFLSNAYSLGGETSSYPWAFDSKPAFFSSYNQEMTRATAAMTSPSTSATASSPEWTAFGVSAIVTVVLSVMRQLFAWFWFHPAGFILGCTARGFIEYVWGSLLAAWVIRGLVLRFGGAVTVRTRLQPFFIGVFLAGVLAYLVLGIHGAWLKSMGVERIYQFLVSP